MPQGGASVRYGDPWAEPPASRDPVRRLRARLVLPVTVWTAAAAAGPGSAGAGQAANGELAGLTVSSVLFAQGDPAMLAGVVSPASDLATLVRHQGARFAVHVLSAAHRRVAQHFAGELPASPEVLAVERSSHGPVLIAVKDRALCTTSAVRQFGWSLLVEAVVDQVQISASAKPLAWYRGEFRQLA
jgi:3-hydroxy-9,10-secoandrosta-1,3,5(10)-triene-9,17-dione monooxygenase reductase component